MLFSQVKKLKVIAERADIYLEPNVKSPIVGTVEKGTILTIQSLTINRTWYYVDFRSPEKNITKSGYVLTLLVEETYEIQKEIKVAEEEKLELILQKLEKLEREIKKPQKVRIEPEKKIKPVEKIKVKPEEVIIKRYDKKLSQVTLGLGAGQSHGGIGGFLQYKTRFGLAFHGGIGYFPASDAITEYDWVKDTVLFGGGIKYYFPLTSNRLFPYLDIQFGGIGVKAHQEITGFDWYSGFTLENIQKTLWGPSFLGGIEIKLGRIGLNGALGFSYNTTDVEWTVQDFFFTLDIGLLIYF